MRTQLTQAVVVVLFSCVVLLGGCGSDPLDRVIVEGTVELDGAPLANGDVTFVPQDPSVQADNLRVVDGVFKGPVIPGAKRVEIRGYEEVVADLPANSPEAGTSFKRQVLPAKFNSQSELNETIPSSGPLSYTVSSS
ncbi:hypothetical protein [Novipirellula caenicola]|uniref:Carboxypeptidase regulatory-like domain-containing protein n=1 Tax=Novipirellula caenicola TaxID=1536901 RepID=A0ABP9VR67_9BACT